MDHVSKYTVSRRLYLQAEFTTSTVCIHPTPRTYIVYTQYVCDRDLHTCRLSTSSIFIAIHNNFKNIQECYVIAFPAVGVAII